LIPPNVQRWLERYQHQQNAQIHQDSQNVHNRQIQQCIKDSLNRIINACHVNDAPTYSSFEQVRNVIVNDSILSPQCKTQLIEYASDQTEHSSLGVTFAEALQYVFTRIDVNENGNEIKRILNQEMSDALCMCFTGRISRLLNCLNVMDPLVSIHIVNLSDMFTDVCQRLIKEGIYTREIHQSQYENELQNDYGYELTKEFRKELEEKFYSQLVYFYENYGPKENSSQQQDENEDTNTKGKKKIVVGKKRKFPEASCSSSEISPDKDVANDQENEEDQEDEDKEDEENENENIEVKQRKSPRLQREKDNERERKP